jgi:hypothetical protein
VSTVNSKSPINNFLIAQNSMICFNFLERVVNYLCLWRLYLTHVEALFSFVVILSVHVQGRFYFGEILDDDEGCDDETSAVLNTLHL